MAYFFQLKHEVFMQASSVKRILGSDTGSCATRRGVDNRLLYFLVVNLTEDCTKWDKTDINNRSW